MPGVCYLEMARAAVERRTARVVSALTDVAWLRPLVVDGECDVLIDLHEEAETEIGFAIYLLESRGLAIPAAIEKGDRVELAVGRARLRPESSAEQPRGTELLGAGVAIELDALLSRCDREIPGDRCYDVFKTTGLAYGPAHRGLRSVRVGHDEQGKVFAMGQVRLPDGLDATCAEYDLHPSILDSALQATVGLWSSDSPTKRERADLRERAALPFALAELEILDRTPEVAWVYVRASSFSATTAHGSGTYAVDADLCDSSGRVCVRLRGVTLRPSKLSPGAPKSSGETTLFTRTWQRRPLHGRSPRTARVEAQS
jgi:hypothetical protein